MKNTSNPLRVLPSLQRKNALPENPDENSKGRFPSWLHRKLPRGKTSEFTSSTTKERNLYTVCEEAKCPNRIECFSRKTATFLALGKSCTRACGFCDIDFNTSPIAPDPLEPDNIAKAAEQLGLRHIVITMVARDDLEDGGAEHIAKIIRAIRAKIPSCTIEVLTSDFHGNHEALNIVLKENPEVFNHNVETIQRLTPTVRHTATFDRSITLLEHAKKTADSRIFIKSGCMVGLGESDEEIFELLRTLKQCSCDIITIGQYLQASKNKLRVHRFVSPQTFTSYQEYGLSIGIPHLYCAPFVRSSYNADTLIQKIQETQ